MPSKTISQLTAATTISDADVFAIDQSGSTKKVAASVVRGGLADANIASGASIALSKLATGALPSGITVAQANLLSAIVNALVPVGSVQSFARSTAPSGWLAADGTTIGSAASGATNASADYSALFTVLWDNWSNTALPILTSAGATSSRTSASADFAANKRLPLPDLRGIFVRGSGSQTIAGTENITYAKTFSAKEQDAMQGHVHSLTANMDPPANLGTSAGGNIYTGVNSKTSSPTTDGTNGIPRTAAESRPANIALLYCIKF
jgi:microcystin-dependent protein